MIKLVIFDCDGVLVDSEGPVSEVLARNLTRHGYPVTAQDCETLFVGGTMAGVGDQVRAQGVPLAADWIDEVYGEIYARLEQGVALIPGIDSVLDQLDQAGLPYCVGSNGSEHKMQITLGQTGLWDRLKDRLFSAHTLGVAKPDPELFLTAARSFGIQPQECLVVEDSKTGVTAALRAGMRCVAYVAQGDGAGMRSMGAEVIHDMAHLPACIGLEPVG